MSKTKPTSSAFWSTIADLSTGRARRILLIAGVVGAISIVSVSRLRPVASIEAMLDDHQPSARALGRIARNFAGMEELLVLVSTPVQTVAHGAIPDDNTTALLAFASRLDKQISSSPTLSSMCSTVQYRPSPDFRSFAKSVVAANALYYLSNDAARKLANRLTPEHMSDQLRRAEESLSAPGPVGSALARAALKDPLALRDFLLGVLPRPSGLSGSGLAASDGFFSEDRTILLIRLRGAKPSSDLDFADAFTNAVKSAAEQVNEDALDLSYTGAYAIASAAQHSIRRDVIKSIVLSVLFLQLLFLFVHRNLWTLPVALLPVALGILVAFAIFSAFGMSLSPITAVIGAILAGLGIDYSIHSLSHYRADRAAGLSHDDAIRHTLTDVGPALVAACATTVVGFLAISQSSVRALREFGLLGAMGLAAALVATVFVLPAILSITMSRRGVIHVRNNSKNSVSARLLRQTVNHRNALLPLGGVIMLSAIGVIAIQSQQHSLFENDLTAMHPRPNQPLETQRRLAKLFKASPDNLLIHLQATAPEALIELAHDVDDRLQSVASQQANIVGSYGLGTLLPRQLSPETRSARFAAFDGDRITADFEHALATSAFNPDAFEDYKNFLRQLVAPGDAPGMNELLHYPALAETVLPARAGQGHSEPTEAITAIITAEPLGDRVNRDTAIEAIRNALRGLPGATLTGLSVVGHDTEQSIRRDLRKLLIIVGSVVILGLIVYFRSFRAAVLALTPAVFGLAVLVACMYLFDLRLNSVNLIALPLLVGIGVDDGIFLVTISRSVHRRNDPAGQLADKLAAGSHAVGMTSLTTMLTFGTLAFTSTPAIRSLGILMALGVTASLVAAVGILMPLLMKDSASTD